MYKKRSLHSNHFERIKKYFRLNLDKHKHRIRSGHLVYSMQDTALISFCSYGFGYYLCYQLKTLDHFSPISEFRRSQLPINYKTHQFSVDFKNFNPFSVNPKVFKYLGCPGFFPRRVGWLVGGEHEHNWNWLTYKLNWDSILYYVNRTTFNSLAIVIWSIE